jgi:transposase
MEYGEVMPQGRAGVIRQIPQVLQRLVQRLPAVLIDTLREQFARLSELDAQILQIERRLNQWHQQDADSQRIAAIPGVGLLTATAAVATMGCTISRNGPARFRVKGPTLHGSPAEPRLGSSTGPFSSRQVFWL